MPGTHVPANAASLAAAAQATANPSTPERDSSMQQRVKAALKADPALENASIAVSTRDGEVTLAGVVTSDAQRAHALQLASGVKGVLRVENELEIQSR
jgi:hyperosmotically inducible protein